MWSSTSRRVIVTDLELSSLASTSSLPPEGIGNASPPTLMLSVSGGKLRFVADLPDNWSPRRRGFDRDCCDFTRTQVLRIGLNIKNNLCHDSPRATRPSITHFALTPASPSISATQAFRTARSPRYKWA